MSRETVHKLLTQSTDKTGIQFFRYIFVGGVAFLVDFASLYVFTDYIGVFYLISAAIAFILGLITNYILSINWVFNRRSLDNKTIEFSFFAFIGIVGLGLNELLIWFFTAEIGLFYLLSKILAAIIILFWNFFARKLTLFR
ncbi:MAG: GtrA family protein [Methanobacteriaceae archaeon]|jgi:putative flippase GtrA|nr:GtrA family protein [Methanobacteriaceae archaeon]OPY21633.1 MAG: GtrA-like protein [Methanobacterium sp. PtaU1.Bin097]